MTIPDGYHLLPPGKLAAVVTYLEMRAQPAPRREFGPTELDVRRIEAPAPERYLELYRRIGGEQLWATRLRLSPGELRATIGDERVEIYALGDGLRDVGIAELDRRVAGECELVYFGVVPELIGTGAARRLMNRTIAAAWSRPIERFWLHTCTLDHPRALGFYERSGFRPYARGVEVFDDPRVRGDLAAGLGAAVPTI